MYPFFFLGGGSCFQVFPFQKLVHVYTFCTTYEVCLEFFPKYSLAILGTIIVATIMKDVVEHGKALGFIN
jgi:hypothetical protein